MASGVFMKVMRDMGAANSRMRTGRPKCIYKTTTGAPSSAAPVGTICYNTYDLKSYICTVATGTWTQIDTTA